MQRALIFFFALLGAGCAPDPLRPGGDNPPGPPEFPIELVQPRNSGRDQVAPVASWLTNPLVARVMQGDQPVAGVTVQWVTPNASARVEPINATSDADGYVRARFFTGPQAGEQTAIATLNGEWLGYRTRAVPGPLAVLRPVTSLVDSVPPGTWFTLRTRVEDSHGNGISGIDVEWLIHYPDYSSHYATPPTDTLGNSEVYSVLVVQPDSILVTAALPNFPTIAPVSFWRKTY